MQVPIWARKFVLDFAETALALVFALNIVFPTDVASASQAAIVIGSALLSAAISAARRAIPAFLAWLATVLNVPQDEGNG